MAGTSTTAHPSPGPPAPDRLPRIRSAVSEDQRENLSISEVSELLDITAHTARYYEWPGLIEAARAEPGHRVYDPKTVKRLDFLVRMRTSGMGISELSRYVELVRAGDATVV